MAVAAATGRLGHDRLQHVVVRALRDINLRLDAGDRLGLIGSNGAGKTTLLRVLAGIYEPVTGSLRVQGSLNALLDPSLGMNSELTGRENILLRGLYAGLPRSALPRLEEDVAAFAELSDFIDLPVRIYSAGMVVRLGFALATAIKPQILLMDEWFLAGDHAFLEKARVRLEEMVRGADILVAVDPPGGDHSRLVHPRAVAGPGSGPRGRTAGAGAGAVPGQADGGAEPVEVM